MKVRRHIPIVLLTISLLMLQGCNVAKHIKMRYANDELVANWQSDNEVIALPTAYIGTKPYVDISINGVSGFRFLIDTGASLTYLNDTEKVNALNLSLGMELDVGGWGDETNSKIYQSYIDNLDLSGAIFQHVSVAILPTSKTKYFLRHDEALFDGVLGHDILKHFSWKFDKNNQSISIRQSSFNTENGDTVIPFDITLSKLAIDAHINLMGKDGFDHELLVDTGSRHYLKLNRLYLDENEIQLPPERVKAADFGLSGRALHERATIAQLSFNNLSLNNVKANLINSDDDDNFWVVGSGLLNQFVSIIDYQRQTLTLRPYANHVFTTRYNLIGLELRKIKSGEFVVRYIMPDFASAHLDIQVGDLITMIDGEPAKEISTDHWLSISDNAGQHQLCRQRENNKCFNVDAQHKQGYSIQN